REQVERRHGDDDVAHQPGLLLHQLDGQQLQARSHGADSRRRESPHVADDSGRFADHAHGDYRRAIRKPMSAPMPALMPTARHGFARTYSSVLFMATFALSVTVDCSSASVWRAASICACTLPRISFSLPSPSLCTVFSRSWASVTTFWMSRLTGFGVVLLRMAFSFV